MTRQQRMVAILQDLLAVCKKHDCEVDSAEAVSDVCVGQIRFPGSTADDFYICPTHAVAWIGLDRYYVGKQYALPLTEGCGHG